MSIRIGSVILGLAASVLVAGLALQTIRVRNVQMGDVTSAAKPIGLRQRLPDRVLDWSATDEPLAPTEIGASAVERTLNYDDVANRVFRRGGSSFGVYIAYWSAGRMPLEKVASHTPDRCWSENGWTCSKMKFPVVVSSANGPLKPAYWRIFVPPNGGTPQYVLYWHLVGDGIYDYGDGFNQRPGVYKWWRDTVHYAFAGSREQYFIRLTSDRPFEELRGDAGFEQVLGALGKLGLQAKG